MSLTFGNCYQLPLKTFAACVHDRFSVCVSVSVSGSRNFSKDFFPKFSNLLQVMAFFRNLALISGKTDQIFTKILSETYLWTRRFPLNFGSHPGPDLETGSGPVPSWLRHVPSQCSFLDTTSTFTKLDFLDSLISYAERKQQQQQQQQQQ